MNRQAGLLIGLLVLVVFNVIFFTTGGPFFGVGAWISYGFITIACISFMVVPLSAQRSPSAAVLIGSLLLVSGIYLFAELVIGCIFIYGFGLAAIPALIVQLVLFALFVALTLSMIAANQKTVQAETSDAAMMADFRSLIAYAQQIATLSNDATIQQAAREVADSLRFSPVLSNEATLQMDARIRGMLDELNSAAQRGDSAAATTIAKEIDCQIAARNQALKGFA